MELSHTFTPYKPLDYNNSEMIERSAGFYSLLDKRRSLRHFSDKSVPKEIIENIIKTASTAPSGAHKQPWTFCAIANPALKRKIRIAAEKEERENYDSRMGIAWLKDLEKFETNWEKPFLEKVPWLIAVFAKPYDIKNDGTRSNNYYVKESVGLASGMLLAAIHNAGLVALTHTPSPMNFLSDVLERPHNERAYLLIPVGYPAPDAKVPVLIRKSMDEVSRFYM